MSAELSSESIAWRASGAPSKGVVVACVLFGLLFGAAVALPLYYTDSGLTNQQAKLVFLPAAILAFCIAYLLCTAATKLPESTARAFSSSRRVFLVCLLILLAVFAIALLCSYPGFCSFDSRHIMNQALGQSHYSPAHRYEGLSAHHPPFYTFLVWVAFSLTSFAGDMDVSIATFMAGQATFVALVVALALAVLNEAKAPAWVIVLALAFYALTPVLAAHAITMWKDTPFSACILLLTAIIVLYVQKGALSARGIVGLAVVLLLTALLRSNGIIVMAATLAVLCLHFRKQVKPLLASFGSIVAVLAFISLVVYPALSVSSAHFAESVSLPLQQLGATIADDGTISKDDREFLDTVLPLEEWKENYNPTLVNDLKLHEQFDDEFLEAHKAEFLMIWLRTMPANLKTYFKAWVLVTYGYWQPGHENTIGYKYTMTKQDDSIVRDKVRDLIGLGYNPHRIANAEKEYFTLLFGMGSYIWLVLLALVLCYARGGRRSMGRCALVLTPILVLFLTLMLASPTFSDYRYVLSLFLVLPLLPYLVASNPRRADVAAIGNQEEAAHE